MFFDVVVVGAGPVGLCFLRSLAGTGLRLAVVERQPREALSTPTDDGREIALTHRSRHTLTALGIWAQFRESEIGTLCRAQVLDGNGRPELLFGQQDARPLGWLVSNCAIRRASYALAVSSPGVHWICGRGVKSLEIGEAGAELRLEGGEVLNARLVVAADGRFSALRGMAGISADRHDFGKAMMVCRMHHTVAHRCTAWEWFGYGQTLAVLLLHDANTASIVLTLAPQAMRALMALDDEALACDMVRRFQGRLGDMQVAGPRCSYPLVGVYAERFVAPSFALLGDAAVGMHPVTAHGFNFGLSGQEILARALCSALARGRPFWADAVLRRYARVHRAETWPLYVTTRHLAHLYTDERPPARVLRRLALTAGAHFTPFRRAIADRLTAAGHS